MYCTTAQQEICPAQLHAQCVVQQKKHKNQKKKKMCKHSKAITQLTAT